MPCTPGSSAHTILLGRSPSPATASPIYGSQHVGRQGNKKTTNIDEQDELTSHCVVVCARQCVCNPRRHPTNHAAKCRARWWRLSPFSRHTAANTYVLRGHLLVKVRPPAQYHRPEPLAPPTKGVPPSRRVTPGRSVSRSPRTHDVSHSSHHTAARRVGSASSQGAAPAKTPQSASAPNLWRQGGHYFLSTGDPGPPQPRGRVASSWVRGQGGQQRLDNPTGPQRRELGVMWGSSPQCRGGPCAQLIHQPRHPCTTERTTVASPQQSPTHRQQPLTQSIQAAIPGEHHQPHTQPHHLHTLCVSPGGPQLAWQPVPRQSRPRPRTPLLLRGPGEAHTHQVRYYTHRQHHTSNHHPARPGHTHTSTHHAVQTCL